MNNRAELSKRGKQSLAQARLRACRIWPFASHAILSMQPVERYGLGTLAVDKKYRLYYDPAFLDQVTPDEAAVVILHEVDHLILRHHKRAQGIVPANDNAAWDRWNRASDAPINDQLLSEGLSLPFEGQYITSESLDLPSGRSAEEYYRLLTEQAEQQESEESDDGLGSDDRRDNECPEQPEGDDQASGHSSESPGDGAGHGDSGADSTEGDRGPGQESGGSDNSPGQTDVGGRSDSGTGDESQGTGARPGSLGQQDEISGQSRHGTASGQRDPSPDGASDGMEGMGSGDGQEDWQGQPLTPGTSGSASDGRLRPWELPEDDDSGLEDHEQEVVERKVAQAIEKAKGDHAGHWKQVVDDILHPKIDPRRLIMRAVAKHTEAMTRGGVGRYSYRRPSRRPGHGGTIRPRSFQPVPRIAVLVDTSGSMDQRALGLAMGMVGKVLDGLHLRDGVRVVCGDAALQTDMRVFDPKRINLQGGGGTEMGQLIVEIDQPEDRKAQRERPELIIVVTDGFTDWPEKQSDASVVACITTPEERIRRIERYIPPRWIDTVYLTT